MNTVAWHKHTFALLAQLTFENKAVCNLNRIMFHSDTFSELLATSALRSQVQEHHSSADQNSLIPCCQILHHSF